MPAPHDRIIAAAAKGALPPLGFRRKGKSRTWLADRGWWLNVVEFQPSAWSKGCYLNVAAHWLWSDMAHLSFDYGGRQPGLEQYETDAQFTAALAALSRAAADEAARLDGLFSNMDAALPVIAGAEWGWPAYDAGMLAGMTGHWLLAAELLDRAIGGVEVPGTLLKPAAERMRALVGVPAEFRTEVVRRIAKQRQLFKLTPGRPLDAPI